jgi:ubiquinone/menaquinone biosynthesis C-methylase UbiE
MAWYKEVFDEEYLKFWAPYITEEQTLKEVEFMEKFLSFFPGCKILDVCCGHGRHCIQLAKRGYEVVGVDLSEKLLEVARKRAEELKLLCSFIHKDARKMDFNEEFDFAINMFTSFGFLESDKEDQKILNSVARALKRGGKFLLDFLNCYAIVRHYVSRTAREFEDGSLMVSFRTFDILTGKNRDKTTFIYPNGQKKSYEIIIRFYTPVELIEMLEIAGLETTHIYGDFQGGKPSLDSSRIIIISQKQG